MRRDVEKYCFRFYVIKRVRAGYNKVFIFQAIASLITENTAQMRCSHATIQVMLSLALFVRNSPYYYDDQNCNHKSGKSCDEFCSKFAYTHNSIYHNDII